MKRSIIAIALAAALLSTSGCIIVNDNSSAPQTKMENPVIENIMARRSVRHYTDQAVPRELLQQIAVCGVNAPNAMNSQDWEVRIIDNPEYFDTVTEVMRKTMPSMVGDDDPKFRNGLRNATAAIAVACPDDEYGMSLINVGLLCENICLSALSLGLGSVIMGGPVLAINSSPEAKPFLDKLNFSEGYKLRIIIGLGYPDEEPAARPRDLGKIKFVD